MVRLFCLVCLITVFCRFEPYCCGDTTRTENVRIGNLEPNDSLGLAADCLASGNDIGAATHLGRHVRANPTHVVFRAQLADILTRLDRLTEAQSQFETAIAYAQDGPKAARERLVHFHTRVMEIARQREDTFAEHLHRGIGLCIVATRLGESGKSDDVERILIKAAGALKEAHERRPDDARPLWYLYQVWTKLDQPRPAEKCLQKAIAAAPLSELTPAELRELHLIGGVSKRRNDCGDRRRP